MRICLQGIGCVCIKNYPPKLMQPSSSTPASIVSAENQNDATIGKVIIFFCHCYTVWESNNAGEARRQSWNGSLKSRCIPGGLCGFTSGIKQKHFAVLSAPRPCWRWLQLQRSCGSPQWYWHIIHYHYYRILHPPLPRNLSMVSYHYLFWFVEVRHLWTLRIAFRVTLLTMRQSMATEGTRRIWVNKSLTATRIYDINK